MDAYRHSGHTTAAASLKSAGHSATASERELVPPSHSRILVLGYPGQRVRTAGAQCAAGGRDRVGPD
eukprot:5345899-Prymnesium_polylepis.1